MRLFNINGRLVSKNFNKYLVNWEKKSASKLQFQVKQFLKPYWVACICYEEAVIPGSLLRVDFLNVTRKVAVEVNGNQHNEFNKFFHNNSRVKFLESLRRDEAKYQWFLKNDFKVIDLDEKDLQVLSKEYIENKFGISI